MAIKSWDPRKLQDQDVRGSRFEYMVADAWEEAHESDGVTPERRQAGRPGDVPTDYRDDWAATHSPFAHLRDQLTRH